MLADKRVATYELQLNACAHGCVCVDMYTDISMQPTPVPTAAPTQHCAVTSWATWGSCSATWFAAIMFMFACVCGRASVGVRLCVCMRVVCICMCAYTRARMHVRLHASVRLHMCAADVCGYACSEGGQYSRTRTVTAVQIGSGTACPVTAQTAVCNSHVCPVDW